MGDLMSSVIISGDTSGAITLAAPSVAGTNTITLPANTGTVITTASTFSGTGPAFSASSSANTAAISATLTKLQLNTELFDTNNNFDSTTNYRFTPTVAGYYQVNAQVLTPSNANLSQVVIFKNGVQYAQATF